MKKIIMIALFLTSLSARADVIDRINQCESQGGGSCVFQILRELASKADDHHGVIRSGIYKDPSGSTATFTSLSGHSFSAQGFGNSSWNGTYECQQQQCRNSTGTEGLFMIASWGELREQPNNNLWTFVQ